MDKIKELEKYKDLLDSGAITEDEFRKLKQSLLGLQTDEEKKAQFQKKRDAALAEIEQMKEKKAAEEQECARIVWEKEQEAVRMAQEQKQEAQRREEEARRKAEDAMYQAAIREEKAKEIARLEAKRELTAKAKAEQQLKVREAAKKTTSVIGKIVLWVLAMLCILMGVGSLSAAKTVLDVLAGIIFLLLAVLACPIITDKTKGIESLKIFYRFKKFIIIGLVVLWVVLVCI